VANQHIHAVQKAIKKQPEIPVTTELINDIRTVLRNLSWGGSMHVFDGELLSKVTGLPSSVMTEVVEVEMPNGLLILEGLAKQKKDSEQVTEKNGNGGNDQCICSHGLARLCSQQIVNSACKLGAQLQRPPLKASQHGMDQLESRNERN
jgi:hypothetical protein